MVIDFHTHIFPKEICSDRENYFPGEAAFKRLYKPPKSRLAHAEMLLAAMDENQVAKSVVFGFPWKNPVRFKRHNDYIQQVVGKYPDRLVGLGCFDPFSQDAPAEAERCLRAGLSGIGELAYYKYGLNDAALDRLEPIMEICRPQATPVLIHTNEPVGHPYPGKTSNTFAQIYKLVNRFGAGVYFFSAF
jgi:predicted TIM-barrel fold metal-dependent hydrolase